MHDSKNSQFDKFDKLLQLVKAMRGAQKRYFAQRGQPGDDTRLQLAKDAERALDAYILELEAVPPPPTLFDPCL